MMGFLPGLAERILGEKLILPNVATWWCGQTLERDHVVAEFDRMVIAPALAPTLPGSCARPRARRQSLARGQGEADRRHLAAGPGLCRAGSGDALDDAGLARRGRGRPAGAAALDPAALCGADGDGWEGDARRLLPHLGPRRCPRRHAAAGAAPPPMSGFFPTARSPRRRLLASPDKVALRRATSTLPSRAAAKISSGSAAMSRRTEQALRVVRAIARRLVDVEAGSGAVSRLVAVLTSSGAADFEKGPAQPGAPRSRGPHRPGELQRRAPPRRSVAPRRLRHPRPPVARCLARRRRPRDPAQPPARRPYWQRPARAGQRGAPHRRRLLRPRAGEHGSPQWLALPGDGPSIDRPRGCPFGTALRPRHRRRRARRAARDRRQPDHLSHPLRDAGGARACARSRPARCWQSARARLPGRRVRHSLSSLPGHAPAGILAPPTGSPRALPRNWRPRDAATLDADTIIGYEQTLMRISDEIALAYFTHRRPSQRSRAETSLALRHRQVTEYSYASPVPFARQVLRLLPVDRPANGSSPATSRSAPSRPSGTTRGISSATG